MFNETIYSVTCSVFIVPVYYLDQNNPRKKTGGQFVIDMFISNENNYIIKHRYENGKTMTIEVSRIYPWVEQQFCEDGKFKYNFEADRYYYD